MQNRINHFSQIRTSRGDLHQIVSTRLASRVALVRLKCSPSDSLPTAQGLRGAIPNGHTTVVVGHEVLLPSRPVEMDRRGPNAS